MILSVQRLSLAIGAKQCLQDISFTVNAGQCHALIGASGSGKSLTASAIIQCLPAHASFSEQTQIIFKQEDISCWPESRLKNIRGREIAMIFQDAMTALNPIMTIGQQLCEVMPKPSSRAERRLHCIELLKQVGLEHGHTIFDAYPHQLSGGMRQRVLIAMATIHRPSLIIADEPTTALDAHRRHQVLTLLQTIQQETQAGLLLISHDLGCVARYADTITLLHEGRIVESQAKTHFFTSQQPQARTLIDAIPRIEAKQSPTDAPIILSAHNVSVHFPLARRAFSRTRSQVAIESIHLNLYQGETMALIGASGSGKSTLAKALIRLIPLHSGTIRHQQHRIPMVFQDTGSTLNPRMTCAQSLCEGLQASTKQYPEPLKQEKIDQALQQVQLSPEFKHRYPHELSGGQRQRIGIARALLVESSIIILDEPTSALDVATGQHILSLLAKLQRNHQLTYLLITHDCSVVAQLAHRVAVMHQGQLVEQGPAEQILTQANNPLTQSLLVKPTLNS